ncbi:hypothetical protein SCAR479_03322 [Seiridium cardinale]|uniref:Uncharacterized protein n=1 Tax=Seiridium cardinale TaxID=138064 RepID=A0ABR2Y0X6_9PEZI
MVEVIEKHRAREWTALPVNYNVHRAPKEALAAPFAPLSHADVACSCFLPRYWCLETEKTRQDAVQPLTLCEIGLSTPSQQILAPDRVPPRLQTDSLEKPRARSATCHFNTAGGSIDILFWNISGKLIGEPFLPSCVVWRRSAPRNRHVVMPRHAPPSKSYPRNPLSYIAHTTQVRTLELKQMHLW